MEKRKHQVAMYGGLRMSINLDVIGKYLEVYPTPADCRMKSVSTRDALPSYEYLESIRSSIPKELYAYNLRALLQCNTENVSPEIRLRMLEGVLWDDIMYQDELDAIKNFDSEITIYRGTDYTESTPGLSWALRKDIAESVPFNRGRVFQATIPKESIIAYLAHEEDETEIIAHVTSGYTIIEDAKK